LQQARGDYVLIIGDDDAAMPGGLDALLARLEAAPEPRVHMWPQHVYNWPVEEFAAKIVYLAAVVPDFKVDLKQKARNAFRLGAWKYYKLPSPYHGAVPRQILTSIRKQTGRVFHSTCPDVFTGMAIPNFTDYAINLGKAVTVQGRSSLANGCVVKQKAEANIAKFLLEYENYRFHHTLVQSLPASASAIPDAVLIARDLFPELYENTEFGYSAMWAYLCRLGLVSHSEVFRRSQHIRRSQDFSLMTFSGYAALQQIAVARSSILEALTTLGALQDRVPDNIHDFVHALPRDPKETPA
jgi:hypothetical protein